MRDIRVILAIPAAGSFLPNTIGPGFTLLMRIDQRGTAAGTGIRVGNVTGGFPFYLGSRG